MRPARAARQATNAPHWRRSASPRLEPDGPEPHPARRPMTARAARRPAGKLQVDACPGMPRFQRAERRGAKQGQVPSYRWTLSRCVDPTMATPDLVGRVGNENDWTQFFWGLTAPGLSSNPNVSDVWTITDTLRPYQALCAGTPPEGDCRTEFTWGVLSTAVDGLAGAGTLTSAQQQRFDALGATRGVSQ